MKVELDEAVRALREESARDDGVQRFTRARVMASLHQGRVKRRTRLAFVLPIAATFVATSAWGVSSGRARLWFEAVGAKLGLRAPEPAPAEPAAKVPVKAPVQRSLPAPAPPSPEQVEPVAPVEPPKPTPEPSPARPSASVSGERTDAELELYKRAHRVHFSGTDPVTALTAWDAYLAAAPAGRFALEARYNRALCLVRLDRKAEARAALEPFARGAFGDYRQREAAELYEALGR